MSDRYTRRDAQIAFERLADALGKKHTPRDATYVMDNGVYQPVPGVWYLDYNSTYGGCVIEEMLDHGITHPFGSVRRTPREFVSAVNFALRVLDEMYADR